MTAPFLPMTKAEMDHLGWETADIILVTGDAYVDHPSFGCALIGRLLEAEGFKVGVIAQPDWNSAEDFKKLGRPNLFFGVTAGNMDSMVNRYTSEKRIRSDDAYTPDGKAGMRPDRAANVYAQRCREAFRDVPIVLGGIEASLRRLAHFDYWSEKVRRSILLDAKADLLVYGNAERAIVEIARRAQAGEQPAQMHDIRGTVYVSNLDKIDDCVRLPSYEEVVAAPKSYALASRLMHQESNPHNAKTLIQPHGDRLVVVNPPPWPLSTPELDRIYELPYARAAHPSYGNARIPAWEMIRFSINILRGCFGGCSFCSITEHEGRIVQSRSEGSVLREIEQMQARMKGFTGVISDLGGPTANMYRLGCKEERIQAICKRLSCVHPTICKNLITDHGPLLSLYRQARNRPGIKKVLIASGLRYDLALASPDYIDELAAHHVGGYLKVAPEHTEAGPLAHMMKPGVSVYEKFQARFLSAARKAGKQLYLIPYFIAAHPGTTDQDMLKLALWLKRHGLKLDQVQTFLPSPMSLATAMYHTGLNPLTPDLKPVYVPKGGRQRRIHKAFLRWHDPENAHLLKEALINMGRKELIGNGLHQLGGLGTAALPKQRLTDCKRK
ncbi:MAG: YgiQ family radical SAM protein [Alphaproteobacteria bacterium]|nr:YgiQ family radical SAM protein [Alphaproteobacteria bacterium]